MKNRSTFNQVLFKLFNQNSLSILGGVIGLISFQSFFFVGEVSVVLLLVSKTTVVVLCNRNVVVDVTLKNDSCTTIAVKQQDVLSHVILKNCE
jgi:hypothetical protein